jgi:hypothetical protein
VFLLFQTECHYIAQAASVSKGWDYRCEPAHLPYFCMGLCNRKMKPSFCFWKLHVHTREIENKKAGNMLVLGGKKFDFMAHTVF